MQELTLQVSSKQIERANQKSVLRCVEQAGEISRAGVAKKLDLSRTTVSSAVAYLMELGLVRETEQASGAQNRGRPGIPLQLTGDTWFAAGAAFTDQELLFVLTDLNGRIVERHSLSVEDLRAETFLNKLTEGFSALLARSPGKVLPLLGVGTPGAVNNGSILRASDMEWENVPVAAHLKKTLGMDSIVVNRHWASCMSEYRFGAGQSIESLIYIGISTGIAASFILDGRLLTGSHHSAGEIGHTVVNRNGRQCNCGSRGCLHTVASEIALLLHINEYYGARKTPAANPDPLFEKLRAGGALSVEDICLAAAGGHPVAFNELQTAALYLGLSVGNLISMFNPQSVILGGSLIDHGGKMFTDMIFESVRMHASSDALVGVQLRAWALGRDSGPLGAALLVLEHKYELAAE